jgi:hypothetical protein
MIGGVKPDAGVYIPPSIENGKIVPPRYEKAPPQ